MKSLTSWSHSFFASLGVVLLAGVALATFSGCGAVSVSSAPKNLMLYPATYPERTDKIPLLKTADGADACAKEVELRDKPGSICDEVRIGYVAPGAMVRTIDCQPRLQACKIQVMEELNTGWKGYLPFTWIKVKPKKEEG